MLFVQENAILLVFVFFFWLFATQVCVTSLFVVIVGAKIAINGDDKCGKLALSLHGNQSLTKKIIFKI